MKLLRWHGPVAYDGRSFYALTPDGKRFRRPRIRLVARPQGDGHYYRLALPWEKSPPPGKLVSLEAEAYGHTETAT